MPDCLVPAVSRATLPLTVLSQKQVSSWLKKQPARVRNWLKGVGFQAKPGEASVVPGGDGKPSLAVGGVDALENAWDYSALASALPKGRYQIINLSSRSEANAAAFGWQMAGYRFARYRKQDELGSKLVWPELADQARVTAWTEGLALCRDLINTPAADLTPEGLANAAKDLGKQHGAKVKVLVGEKQLAEFPAVFAVGKAAAVAPRLVDLQWGKAGAPRLTLVGKGVVFDSGGLDLKSAANMKLMKKDMGGAALVLGVAHAIMSLGLPVQLRVLIPAVENAIGGNAMRPLDVLQTRKGLTVEVGNTDAEGRLILSDALAAADEEDPDLIIDAATLTGAARVALGTGLPALFSTDDEAAEQLLEAGLSVGDPLWRMPLHAPYRSQLESPVADLNNISPGGYGGAITAALFLQHFVSDKRRWMHIDTMGWNLESQPGRPTGGEGLALRALVEMLSARYGG